MRYEGSITGGQADSRLQPVEDEQAQ